MYFYLVPATCQRVIYSVILLCFFVDVNLIRPVINSAISVLRLLHGYNVIFVQLLLNKTSFVLKDKPANFVMCMEIFLDGQSS